MYDANDIVSTEGERTLNITPPADYADRAAGARPAPIEKKITLDINGSGAIDVSGGVSDDTILGLLRTHVEPILLDIINRERFEEGDLAYEF